MIDTHAHIRMDDELKIDGLELVILSASNIEDSGVNLNLSRENDRLYPAVGIHPQDVPIEIDTAIFELEEMLIKNKQIVAVGECGMDFSRDYDLDKQTELFRGQIELAIKYDKPLIIHSRKAMDETIETLTSYKNLKGVVHCYSGGKKRISRIMNMEGEWYFGIDGNLTYEPGLQEVVLNIPKDRLVLETDSPELAPIPFKGQTNYPEYVRYVYETVSKLWKVSLEETENQIDSNARRLFQV
ncbi:TatD family hydrolase [Candidatus Shapirobacteria bacterium]|nr:TatD family hydrolase [Candidatus Shapirobacteria bacterium]